MQAVTISEVKKLVGARGDPAVSIYLDLDPRRPGGAGDRERLRKLLRRAAELLSTTHARDEIDALLVPIAERASPASAPWPRAAAVAFLRSRRLDAAFALPVGAGELTIVASTFHVKPLLHVLDGGGRFFLLVLGDRAARLLEGVAGGSAGIDGSLLVTGAGRDGGARSDREALEAIDEAVREVLGDGGATLVLAGPGRLRALYRAVSRYEWLLPEGIEADVEQVHAADLRPVAAELVAAHRAAVEAEAATRFLSAEAYGCATDDLERVARAASAGAVRLLLHRRGAHVWGRVDPGSGACFVRGELREAGDADVVDDLCELTLLHGGTVVEVAPERMPTAGALAAIVGDAPRVRATSSRNSFQQVTG
jgi:hypothetical protein